MSSQPRSMAANTKAGRRNGSYQKSHQWNKESAKNYPREERRRDRRIYTVKVSTRDGTAIYKAWEHTDNDMDNHFRDADQRFFSFNDVRGKTIHNVDVNSGWRYKMTLRWNPHKVAHDGSKGDWQDLRQWHHEREQRREHQEKKYQAPPASPQHEEEKKVHEMNQQEIASQEMLPAITVVYKPQGGKGAPQQQEDPKPPALTRKNAGDGTAVEWSASEDEEGEQQEEEKNTRENINALEAEKTELLRMLSAGK
jgi:predicted DCC family thiol-disulfide oxidoreductase YuxK